VFIFDTLFDYFAQVAQISAWQALLLAQELKPLYMLADRRLCYNP
jgi:hypothetical protein